MTGLNEQGNGMSKQAEKEAWAQEYARRMEHEFEKWQKPLGITGGAYVRHVKRELMVW